MFFRDEGDTNSKGKKRLFRDLLKLRGRTRHSTAPSVPLNHEDAIPSVSAPQVLQRRQASPQTFPKQLTVTTNQASMHDLQRSSTTEPQISGFARTPAITKNYEDAISLISNTTFEQSLWNQTYSNFEAATENGQHMMLLPEEASEHNSSVVEIPQQITRRELSQNEKDCLQALCLDPPYSDFKELIYDRIEGTCMWFLSQQAYKDWIKQTGSCLMVSADPGCGKSVLAKFLVDQELPRSCPDAIICYFFFKDQIQDTLCVALCGLLHQLLWAEPRLIKHAQAKSEKYGLNLQGNAQALFDIITDALADPIGVSAIFVLDALDECKESDCRKLFRFLRSSETTGRSGRLKMLLTSRPYHNIVSDFEPDALDLTYLTTISESTSQDRQHYARVHIPGELESEIISQEVNLVIKHRLQDLYQRGQLKKQVCEELEKNLLQDCNRTYLWVHLLCEEMQHMIKPTWQETERKLRTLPKSVNEAYERILSRNTVDEEIRKYTVRTLCVVLAAKRALTLREIQIAIKIRLDPPSSSLEDLDLEEDSDFAVKLRNWCGLLVQIYRGRVTFLHQTVREFLLAKEVMSSESPVKAWLWQGFIQLEHAHSIMAQCCLVYLHLPSLQLTELHAHYRNGVIPKHEIFGRVWNLYQLGPYAIEYWDCHFVDGCCQTSKHFLTMARNICDPTFPAHTFLMVHGLYKDITVRHWLVAAATLDSRLFSALLASALLAEEEHGGSLNHDLCTQALLAAIRSGREANVDLILSRGGNPNHPGSEGCGSLHHHVSPEYCREFLKYRAQTDIQDYSGPTPLTSAIFGNRSFEKTKLLLHHKATLTFFDFIHPEVRQYISEHIERTSKKLISVNYFSQPGYQLEATKRSRIAFVRAATKTMRLLLKHDVKSNVQDLRGSMIRQCHSKRRRTSDTILPLLSYDSESEIPERKILIRRHSLSEMLPTERVFWENHQGNRMSRLLHALRTFGRSGSL